VPLSVFTVSPFNLIVGDHIYVKITATNFYGESVTSNVGDGSIVIVVPDAPLYL
jgi:hypothetical protein